MANQPGTVSIRIKADTHKRINDVAALLKLRQGLKSIPTIDEAINAGLDGLDFGTIAQDSNRATASQ